MKELIINKLFLCILPFIFCSSNHGQSIHSLINQESKVEVIKFMGTITTQPYTVDEKIFWNNRDEHAKLSIRNNDFIDDVKSLKNHSYEYFHEINYAFIIVNRNQIDTIYSDDTLKSWFLKEGNQEIYFYDDKGEIAKNLRLSYSFFYDCW